MNVMNLAGYTVLKTHAEQIRQCMRDIETIRKDVKPTSTQEHLRRMEYTGRLPKFSVMD